MKTDDLKSSPGKIPGGIPEVFVLIGATMVVFGVGESIIAALAAPNFWRTSPWIPNCAEQLLIAMYGAPNTALSLMSPALGGGRQRLHGLCPAGGMCRARRR
jgi:hypothetical protein